MANFFAQASSGYDLISTQTKAQQQVTGSLLRQAGERVGRFRPSTQPTRQLQPTAGQQQAFGASQNILSRINQPRSPNAGIEGARSILQGRQGGQPQGGGGSQQGGQQKPEESLAEVLNKGLSGVLQKVLQLVGGGRI